MKNRNLTGFTLVEVLIVIAIIGLLAAIIIPFIAKISTEAERLSEKPRIVVRNAIAENGLNAEQPVNLGNGWYYLSKKAVQSGALSKMPPLGMTNVTSWSVIPTERINRGEANREAGGTLISRVSNELGITNGNFILIQ